MVRHGITYYRKSRKIIQSTSGAKSAFKPVPKHLRKNDAITISHITVIRPTRPLEEMRQPEGLKEPDVTKHQLQFSEVDVPKAETEQNRPVSDLNLHNLQNAYESVPVHKSDPKVNTADTDVGMNYSYYQSFPKPTFYPPELYQRDITQTSQMLKPLRKLELYPVQIHIPDYKTDYDASQLVKQDHDIHGMDYRRAEIVQNLAMKHNPPETMIKPEQFEPAAPDVPFEVLLNKHNRFQCNKCWKDYMHKPGLVQHQKYECGKKPTFKCDFCERSFHRKASLKVHANKLHHQMLTYMKL